MICTVVHQRSSPDAQINPRRSVTGSRIDFISINTNLKQRYVEKLMEDLIFWLDQKFRIKAFELESIAKGKLAQADMCKTQPQASSKNQNSRVL